MNKDAFTSMLHSLKTIAKDNLETVRACAQPGRISLLPPIQAPLTTTGYVSPLVKAGLQKQKKKVEPHQTYQGRKHLTICIKRGRNLHLKPLVAGT